jgi:hypothetical protein
MSIATLSEPFYMDTVGTVLCPVCNLTLLNSRGFVQHLQHKRRAGCAKHIEWQDGYETQRRAAGVKTCRKCRVEKLLIKFGKAGGSRDGRRNLCSECEEIQNREKNPDRIGKYVRKARAVPGSRGTERDAMLRKTYGITQEEYVKLLESQNKCCAICGATNNGLNRHGTPANFHVDHDHVTGRVRGLLCFPCNHGLGMFKDSIPRLESAAKYLRVP